MDTRAKAIIAALVVAVLGLGAALGVVAATGGGDNDDAGIGMMGGGQARNGYMGMMQAMGGMDSDAMLQYMRSVLGDQAYQQMLDHFQQHRNGGMTGNPGIDAMMHGMMDGMLQQMPMDRGNMMPGPGIATPSASPTPAR